MTSTKTDPIDDIETSVSSVLSSINTSPRSPTFQSFSPRMSVSSSPIGHQKMNSASELSTYSYRDSGYFRDTLTREQMSAQRTIKELEKKVTDLTTEIERSKTDHQESIDLNRTHVRKIKQLELELSQVKIVNKTMLEDNKKHQLMLNEKDAEYRKLKELYENELAKNATLSKNSSDLDVEINRSGGSLVGERVHKECDHTLIEELQNEIKTLKDDNQSMNQYIQKMLNRIMEVDGFEETLATNWTPESHKKLPKVNTRVSAPVTPVTSNNSSINSLPLKPRNKSLSDFKFPTVTPSNFSTANSSSSSSPTTANSKFSLTPLTTSLINSLTVKEEIIIDNDSGLNNNSDTASRKSRTSDDYSVTNAPRRTQNLNSGSNNNKRFSILKWGSYAFGTNAAALAAAKKDDPRMKPILLVEKNRE
ncbi:m protein, serotype 2.1 precursor [Gigaspora margarita]|uniref:M protein, serotype 2.1 n=1 Tax=Gigaspora margarita TaxID=4874 RepID=A0A8H3ZZ70_GIGMA|nr:m protein, serotype 2.1 precursor [Gigaspora margarita]